MSTAVVDRVTNGDVDRYLRRAHCDGLTMRGIRKREDREHRAIAAAQKYLRRQCSPDYLDYVERLRAACRTRRQLRIAVLRVDGYSLTEIGSELQCNVRTIQREWRAVRRNLPQPCRYRYIGLAHLLRQLDTDRSNWPAYLLRLASAIF